MTVQRPSLVDLLRQRLRLLQPEGDLVFDVGIVRDVLPLEVGQVEALVPRAVFVPLDLRAFRRLDAVDEMSRQSLVRWGTY